MYSEAKKLKLVAERIIVREECRKLIYGEIYRENANMSSENIDNNNISENLRFPGLILGKPGLIVPLLN